MVANTSILKTLTKITFIVSFLLSTGQLQAQNEEAISTLEKKLRGMINNAEKVNILNNLVEEILKPEPTVESSKRAKSYAHDAAKISESLNYKGGMARSYEQLTIIYKTLDYQIQYLKYKTKAAMVDRGSEIKEQQEALEKQQKEIQAQNDEMRAQNEALVKQQEALKKQQLEANKIKQEISVLSKDNVQNKSLIQAKQNELKQKEEALAETNEKLDVMDKEREQLSMENKLLAQDREIKSLEAKREKTQKYFLMSILGAIIILFLFLFSLYRNKQKTARELAAKNEIILAEQKRSDELLLNILPFETANELKATGKAKAQDYEMVTVLLTDFKDFTIISEKLTPKELVDEIDLCFTAFDSIVEKYGIEKIKTIGDAYLCAHGVPLGANHDPHLVIKAAIEIAEFMREIRTLRNTEGRVFFDIRIGIHTGPLVAGVVGRKKFAYDIWGDTVNTAARMEQNSEPGRINVSNSTFELVKDQFNFRYRGKIEAKNKGQIDMYFLEEEMQSS